MTGLTRADAVLLGDHVRERRTGEVRQVVGIARTLTERRFTLDDGSFFDAMFLDMVHVTDGPVSDRLAYTTTNHEVRRQSND